MKFWITCRDDSGSYYEIHVRKPEWKPDPVIGPFWHSISSFYVCERTLRRWFGSGGYDPPKVGECWEFSVKDDIWIDSVT